MDHTVTDGEGGLRMSMAFIDLERDAPDPPPVDRATGSSGGGLPLGNLLETIGPVSYTHLRAHETVLDIVCRLLLEKKNQHNPVSL